MICSSAFLKQKCKNFKNFSLTFFKFQSIPAYPVSIARGTNRQFYCTRVIIYNKTRQLFYVSVYRQTFLGFEMTSNLLDTSPLSHDNTSDFLMARANRIFVNVVTPAQGKNRTCNHALIDRRRDSKVQLTEFHTFFFCLFFFLQ